MPSEYWTEEREEELIRLYDVEKMTNGEIGRLWGVTRNKISGKVNRLKAKGRIKRQDAQPKKPRSLEPESPSASVQAPTPPEKRGVVEQIKGLFKRPSEPGTKAPFTVTDQFHEEYVDPGWKTRNAGQCKKVLSIPNDWRYCKAPADKDGYCLDHKRDAGKFAPLRERFPKTWRKGVKND